jgi:hypothetical protein
LIRLRFQFVHVFSTKAWDASRNYETVMHQFLYFALIIPVRYASLFYPAAFLLLLSDLIFSRVLR